MTPDAIRMLGQVFGLVPAPGREEPFVYSRIVALSDALAIGQTVTDTIQFDTGRDFVAQVIRVGARVDDNGRVVTLDDATADSELGGQPDAPFLVNFVEAGASKAMHDRPVDARLVYDGRPLARPKVFRGGTTLGIELTTLKQAAAGTGFDVSVVLIGYNILRAP